MALAEELIEFALRYKMARINLGREIIGEIVDFDGFDAAEDAETLEDAIGRSRRTRLGEALEDLGPGLRSRGTDEETIIDILGNRTNEQRMLIRVAYHATYDRSLKEDLLNDVGGPFEKTVEALMEPPPVSDARSLREAMRGPGTDENVIIEIMCTRVNDEIEAIKLAYALVYERDLHEDLASETSGNYGWLMQAICSGQRDESDEVEEGQAIIDAKLIFEAGEDRWGTNENVFTRILATRSFPQLRATFVAYQAIAEVDIEDSIRDECSGDLQDGYLTIVKRARECGVYFADRLFLSLLGPGVDEDTLVRVICSRAEIDLRRIKLAFFVKYERSLHSFIVDECHGDFKRMLLAIIHGEEVE